MLWLLVGVLLVQDYDTAMARGVAAMEAGRLQEAADAFRDAAAHSPNEVAPKLLLAEVRIALGRPKLALDALEALPSPVASDAKVRCLRGRALLGIGEIARAREQLETALDTLDDPACREAVAVARLESGDVEGALTALEPLVAATAESQRSPAFQATYGIALAQSGRFEDAIAPLRAALEDQPRRSRALFHLGRSLQSLERFDEAADVYRNGLDFAPPENIRFALGLARCLIRLGHIGEARRHLDELVVAHPNVGRAWLLRGIVAFEEHRLEDSVADIEKAQELGYRLPESDLRLGMALGTLGRYAEAQQALDDALGKDAELAAAYYYKGLFLYQEGEELAASGGHNPFGVHALRYLERSHAVTPNPQTSLVMAEAYLRVGQHRRAATAAVDASAASALAPRALHLKALAHHELLEYDAAEESYRAAIANGADSAELYHDYGNLLSVMGRWDEAKTMLQESLGRDASYAGAYLQLGIVSLNLRQLDEAQRHLERFLSLAPESAEGWYQKGVVASRQSNPEAAVESWKKALELDPGQSRLLYRLGAELVKLGRLAERNALLSQFQEIQREAELATQKDERLANLLAGALQADDDGDDTRALELLDQALQLAPDDARPYVYTANVHLSRRRFVEAESVLLQGLDRLPEDLGLHQMLLATYDATGKADAVEGVRARILELTLR